MRDGWQGKPDSIPGRGWETVTRKPMLMVSALNLSCHQPFTHSTDAIHSKFKQQKKSVPLSMTASRLIQPIQVTDTLIGHFLFDVIRQHGFQCFANDSSRADARTHTLPALLLLLLLLPLLLLRDFLISESSSYKQIGAGEK